MFEATKPSKEKWVALQARSSNKLEDNLAETVEGNTMQESRSTDNCYLWTPPQKELSSKFKEMWTSSTKGLDIQTIEISNS
ncbi:hypothetical protein LIER_28260 [Lithospermum erythrorhizon]|uniref:Uncharacterized protein n=1 Tax=Lithospermum erythrorhizon TaxID=34254 RepID=A0AAV3RJ04_LITER